MPALPPRLSTRVLPAAAAGAALCLGAVAPAAAAGPARLPAGAQSTTPQPAAAADPAAAAPARASSIDEAAFLRTLQERTVRHVDRGRPGPSGPDPRRALVPDPSRLDWGGWLHAGSSTSAARSQERRAQRAPGADEAEPQTVREDEPRGTRGSNDTLDDAQQVTGFGTRSNPMALLVGRLSPQPLAPGSVERVRPNREDDGTFETARDTGISEQRAGVRTTGRIGDAEESYDQDLYRMTLGAGELVEATVTRTSGAFEPFAYLVDEEFRIVAAAEFDDDLETATLRGTTRAAGNHYLVTLGFETFDPETGEVVEPKGRYALTLTARPGDRDVYAVDARAGDVLGVSVSDAASFVSVYDNEQTEVHGSPYDASFIYPPANPLPGGGNAVTDHVVRRTGTHYVEVTAGDGSYLADVEVYRYGGAARRTTQTVVLDTDGERLNTGIFGGRGVTRLSPLRAFLGRWGLPRSAEPALVRRIEATVRENLVADLRAAGLSDSVDLRVVTTPDDPDTFGDPDVSRVVVGGTIEQSGLPTIGIAQSIDPGNFDQEETSLVLLDLLSEPGDRQEAPYSLNSYLTRRSDRVAFLGRAIGNVVSHEIGHTIGNWHVDETNDVADVMDAGGNFPQLFGVGEDGIGGTADDPDVDFGRDAFNLFEGFTGIEDTQSRSTFGLSRGSGRLAGVG